MNDSNGREITPGCKVRHIDPSGFNRMGGAVLEVDRIAGVVVVLKSHIKRHIPIHAPSLLVVVEGPE